MVSDLSSRPRLATLRLVLRALTPADRPALIDLLGRWDVVKNLARWPYPLDPKMVDDLIDRHKSDPTCGFGIDLGGDIIGLISTGQTVGFMLHPDHWGKGFMAEALHAVQTYGFETLGYQAMKGHALVDNPGSARVFEKCGWQEVGQGLCHSKARDQDVADRVFLIAKRMDWLTPLTTDRLTIRPMQPRDVDALWPMLNDHEIVKMLYTWPWPADRDFTQTRFESADARAGLFSAITHQNQTIGFIGCLQGSLFYSLDRAHWGQGFASEAAKATIARAFSDPETDQLTAGTWDDNPASAHILTKLGFKQTGRDTIFHPARGTDASGPDFELTRKDWEERDTH